MYDQMLTALSAKERQAASPKIERASSYSGSEGWLAVGEARRHVTLCHLETILKVA